MRDTIFTRQTINNGNLSFSFFSTAWSCRVHFNIFPHCWAFKPRISIVAELQFHPSLDLIRCDLWHWQTMNIFRFVCRARDSLLSHVGGENRFLNEQSNDCDNHSQTVFVIFKYLLFAFYSANFVILAFTAAHNIESRPRQRFHSISLLFINFSCSTFPSFHPTAVFFSSSTLLSFLCFHIQIDNFFLLLLFSAHTRDLLNSFTI